MWCHGRYKWSHKPRGNAAAWAGGGERRLGGCGYTVRAKGHPSLTPGDRAFTGKQTLARGQFGMPPLLSREDYWLTKQMPPQRAKRVRS